MANNINSKSIGLFIVVAIGLIFAIYTGCFEYENFFR